MPDDGQNDEGGSAIFNASKPKHRILPALKVAHAWLAALIVVAPNWVAAQQAPSVPSAITRGIRHMLYLTVKSDDSDLRLLRQRSGEPHTATLNVKVRISDHSQETDFSGDVSATVVDFDPIQGSREQEIWKDAECHHERGFPKITVIGVDGQITNGQKKLTIAASYRRFGVVLPKDEVMAARRLASGTDEHGSFVATRTETKQSHLLMDLRLYMLPCDIQSPRIKRPFRSSAESTFPTSSSYGNRGKLGQELLADAFIRAAESPSSGFRNRL